MNKLIKIKNDYYIVDDSEIEIEDKSLLILDNFEPTVLTHFEKVEKDYKGKKITHSTQKGVGIQLNLEDIEKLVYGYSVEKMAQNNLKQQNWDTTLGLPFNDGFIKGYINAHQELVKDKLFTIEDMEYCYNTAKRRAVMQEAGLEPDLGFKDYMNKYHTSKTEWEIKFEDNKIVLI